MNWRNLSRYFVTPVDRPPVTVEHTVLPAEADPAEIKSRTWLDEAEKPPAERDTVLMDACLDDWLKLRRAAPGA